MGIINVVLIAQRSNQITPITGYFWSITSGHPGVTSVVDITGKIDTTTNFGHDIVSISCDQSTLTDLELDPEYKVLTSDYTDKYLAVSENHQNSNQIPTDQEIDDLQSFLSSIEIVMDDEEKNLCKTNQRSYTVDFIKNKMIM